MMFGLNYRKDRAMRGNRKKGSKSETSTLSTETENSFLLLSPKFKLTSEKRPTALKFILRKSWGEWSGERRREGGDRIRFIAPLFFFSRSFFPLKAKQRSQEKESLPFTMVLLGVCS